jgi:hypothetical protein
MTTNAPVGPPIWTREPPSAEMTKPAMTAEDAGLGFNAGSNRESHRKRKRDDPGR